MCRVRSRNCERYTLSLLLLLSVVSTALVKADLTCKLDSCADVSDTHAHITVTVANGIASIAVTIDQPKIADIRGVFFDVSNRLNSDTITCSPSGSDVTRFQQGTNQISGSSDVNLNGCPRHAYDYAVEIGHHGLGGNDDIQHTTVTFTCQSLPPSPLALTEADFAGMLFGLRLTSVGTAGSRSGSDKLNCTMSGGSEGNTLPCPDGCNTECPVPAKCGWVLTWSTGCTATDNSHCGKGKQTLTSVCWCDDVLDPTGNSCKFLSPPTGDDAERVCEDNNGCKDCKWQYEWPNPSTCVATDGSKCGKGKETAKVECNCNGVLVDKSICLSKMDPPETERDCDDVSNCKECDWQGEWSTCHPPNYCGNSTHSRTARCMCGNIETPDEICREFARKGDPVLEEPCQNFEGCNCEWQYSPYGECQADDGCSDGTQHRESGKCVATNAALGVDENDPETFCKLDDGVKCKDPELSRSCEDRSKCICDWTYTDDEECSSPCSDQTRSRTATCKCGPYTDGTGAACACKEKGCIENCPCHEGCKCDWKTSLTGQCSTTCGFGTQSQAAHCQATTIQDTLYNCDRKSCLEDEPPSSVSCGPITTGCYATCKATECAGGTSGAVTNVKFQLLNDGSGGFGGNLMISGPLYGDIRGVFINLGGSKISTSCTITSALPTVMQTNTNVISSQSSDNMQGCNSPASYQIAAAFGQEGVGAGKGDYPSVDFVLNCGYKGTNPDNSKIPYSIADLDGAIVGVRVTSIGNSLSDRTGSAKQQCVVRANIGTGRRRF